MTTVYFLRHGLTQENKEGRIQGQQPGTLLATETERYLASVVPLLRQCNPEILLSSDLERAVQTRVILKKFLQIPDTRESQSPLLRERAMGFYEGMLWSEVPRQYQAQRYLDEYDFSAFGGETSKDVQARVQYFISLCARQYINKVLCAVTHAGWLRQLNVLAHQKGVGIYTDHWSDRSGIYEIEVGTGGELVSFSPLAINTEPLFENTDLSYKKGSP